MKVLIIEDEVAASDNLIFILKSLRPDIEVLKVIDSVVDAIDYLSKPTDAVLVFMDIHLADGVSFEIFEKVKIEIPIIFTTAYDHYAIQAFKVNSLDYLLKPITEVDLKGSLEKFYRTNSNKIEKQLKGILSLLKKSPNFYKLSYLIEKKDELIPINVVDIAYFYIDMSIVKAVTFDNQEYVLNKKLETIEAELYPAEFFRINRQYILNKQSIDKLKFHFNGKLIVVVRPKTSERIIVSKLKSMEIRSWLNT